MNFAHKTNTFKHVCPRNCYSACTMISHVENDRLVHITGDKSHPYTKGKLCAKGYAYIERNYHRDRLKYPYYQEIKGSGKLKQITWEKAFDLLLTEMLKIHDKYDSFLPLALYKYSGNLGVHHYVTEHFFSSLGPTTTIVGSPCSSAGFEAIQYDSGDTKMSDPAQISESKLVIIWGANPSATNIHLIPLLLEAKGKGAKIVVIDPVYTQTAELADLYIQLYPSTDGALATALIKCLFELDYLDKHFIENYSTGFDKFIATITTMETSQYLQICGIPEDALNLLKSWIIDAENVAHIIGFGIQRHSNGGQNIRAIQALAAARGDISRQGGGIYYGHVGSGRFNNQLSHFGKFDSYRTVNMNDWIEQSKHLSLIPPLEMMWISCRNPLTQDPNPNLIRNNLREIPFVVTVEQFLTPTAEMSNLILPTTTHFEELDIVMSYWHKKMHLNEKAITPYYESRSEWSIMKELAVKLNKSKANLCTFPLHTSEEEYLNDQFNQEIYELFKIRNIADLKRNGATKQEDSIAWNDKQFKTSTGKFQFYSMEASQNGFPATAKFVDGKHPPKEYPFWYITAHHPYALNSQFQFLELSDEKEAYVQINATMARQLGIINGEVIKIYNAQDSIEIKALYSDSVPIDILVIYQGWYPLSQVNVNDLIAVLETDMGEQFSGAKGIAFYDTFVNISKL